MTASQLTVPPATCTVLLLAESEGERERWLQVLGELQRLLLDTRPQPRPVYTLKEAYDNGLPLLPHALCAAIIGEPPTGGGGHRPGQASGWIDLMAGQNELVNHVSHRWQSLAPRTAVHRRSSSRRGCWAWLPWPHSWGAGPRLEGSRVQLGLPGE